MSGECNACKLFSLKILDLVDVSKMFESTNLVQWDLSGHTQCKIKTLCTLQELLQKFNEKFPAYKLHAYINRIQNKKFRELKDNLQVEFMKFLGIAFSLFLFFERIIKH